LKKNGIAPAAAGNVKNKIPIKGTVDAVDIKLAQATMPGLPAIRVINMSTLKGKRRSSRILCLQSKDRE